MDSALDKYENRGYERGFEQSGERFVKLCNILIEDERMVALKLALEDKNCRRVLLNELVPMELQYLNKGEIKTMSDVMDRIEDMGYKKGLEQGEDRFVELSGFLIENGRMEDLKRVSNDKDYRKKLLDELVPENIMN